jgi:uroporphyrinogen decarboxylase
MAELTSLERVKRTFEFRDVDRAPAFESFWGDTVAKWRSEGHLGADEAPEDHFGLDCRTAGWINMIANCDKPGEVVEETEETRLVRNPDGALLRWHKQHASTPEHVDFLVQDRQSWERHVRDALADETLDEMRLDVEGYAAQREKCRQEKLFFFWQGINVFESIHPMCGHEYMLMGMALEPDWVREMCELYADVIIRCQRKLFEAAGRPDGIWFFEDMGFKEKPFMSPAMYRELVQPAHERTFGFAHEMDLPVCVHSCGFVEPLVDGLVEAGMDMLQAMEVKAGMDPVRLKEKFGDRLALCGGLDVRTMTGNDRDAIDAELEAKLPAVTAGGGYMLHSDHSIPDQVEYETYRYFLRRGRELSAR